MKDLRIMALLALSIQSLEARVLEPQVLTFSNNHTFVRLNSEKDPLFNLTQEDVEIATKEVWDSTSFMKAAFTAFAARTYGARSIIVRGDFSATNVADIEGSLDIESLLAVSGCDQWVKGRATKMLRYQYPVRKPATEDFVIASRTHRELAQNVSEALDRSNFGISELLARPEVYRGKSVYLFMAASQDVNKNILQTLADISALKAKAACHIHLVAPYLPYARTDKPDRPFGAGTQGKLIANFFTAMGVDAMTIVRPHAPQSLGFFDIPCFEVNGRDTIRKYFENEAQLDTIISPDAGFQKDASRYAFEMGGLPVVVMNKERSADGCSRVLGSTGLERIREKRVAIIDDETASGGTLAEVSEIVQGMQPSRMYTVVTHLAGDAGKALESEYVHKLVVTDSLPVKMEHPKLKVISIAPELAGHIAALQTR